jgi:hypothetical protein
MYIEFEEIIDLSINLLKIVDTLCLIMGSYLVSMSTVGLWAMILNNTIKLSLETLLNLISITIPIDFRIQIHI